MCAEDCKFLSVGLAHVWMLVAAAAASFTVRRETPVSSLFAGFVRACACLCFPLESRCVGGVRSPWHFGSQFWIRSFGGNPDSGGKKKT